MCLIFVVMSKQTRRSNIERVLLPTFTCRMIFCTWCNLNIYMYIYIVSYLHFKWDQHFGLHECTGALWYLTKHYCSLWTMVWCRGLASICLVFIHMLMLIWYQKCIFVNICNVFSLLLPHLCIKVMAKSKHGLLWYQ